MKLGSSRRVEWVVRAIEWFSWWTTVTRGSEFTPITLKSLAVIGTGRASTACARHAHRTGARRPVPLPSLRRLHPRRPCLRASRARSPGASRSQSPNAHRSPGASRSRSPSAAPSSRRSPSAYRSPRALPALSVSGRGLRTRIALPPPVSPGPSQTPVPRMSGTGPPIVIADPLGAVATVVPPKRNLTLPGPDAAIGRDSGAGLAPRSGSARWLSAGPPLVDAGGFEVRPGRRSQASAGPDTGRPARDLAVVTACRSRHAVTPELWATDARGLATASAASAGGRPRADADSGHGPVRHHRPALLGLGRSSARPMAK